MKRLKIPVEKYFHIDVINVGLFDAGNSDLFHLAQGLL
jgi:hypothetical protein